MEYKKPKKHPLRPFILIMIGLVSIVAADLFLRDGLRNVWDSYKTGRSDERLADISSLKARHNDYMREGIDIDPDMLAVNKHLSPPDSIGNVVDVRGVQSKDILTIDDLIAESQKAELAADIAPASGVESKAAGNIFSREEDKHLIEPVPEETEQDMPHILSALGVSNKKEINPSVEEDIIAADATEEELDNIVVEPEPISTHHYSEPKGQGLVTIIIDDMGVSLRSRQVEALPGPLTLAYLPYAKNLPGRTQRALQNGHELMLHMPMEAMNGDLDGGPNVLRTTQNKADFIETLEWGLSSFDGFVGINNHMGSRLTDNKDAMRRLMDHLKGKNLFFVDSKTIGSSVAADTARRAGIPYAERDVFLDHEMTRDFVTKALQKLEHIARSKGHAIAIGHPHKETIAALKEWLPTLKDKGLTLVPASKVIKYPAPANNNDLAATNAVDAASISAVR